MMAGGNTLMRDDLAVVWGSRFIFCMAAMLVGAAALAQAPGPDDGPAKKFLADYAKAWNAGDLEALGRMWMPDGELIDAQGVVIDRKALLANRLAKSEGTRPKLLISLDEVRLLAPNVALVEGESRLAPPNGGGYQRTRFLGVLLEQDGAWRIRLIRQLSSRQLPQAPPPEPLKDLQWMIGEWAGLGEGMRVHASAQVELGGRYIVTRYVYEPEGGKEYDAEVRAGWDPETRSIKSWYFDSRGVTSSTAWEKNGDHWVGTINGTQSDGERFTGNMVITQIDKDSYLRTMSNLKMGDHTVPDQELRMFRVPAQPAE